MATIILSGTAREATGKGPARHSGVGRNRLEHRADALLRRGRGEPSADRWVIEVAVDDALGALLSGTKDRLKRLNEENNALGWVGWRGSREEKIYELLLLAHNIAIMTASADLAFSRLKIKATALNTVALTCQ